MEVLSKIFVVERVKAEVVRSHLRYAARGVASVDGVAGRLAAMCQAWQGVTS